MKEILKRLEIIKSGVALEDEEIIELQIIKLQKLSIDKAVEEIIVKLEENDFFTALGLIDEYLSKYSGVVLYDDKELASLKLELKALENRLQNIIEQKNEYLNDIDKFNREYNIHLGELISAILNLKKEILYKKTIKKIQLQEKYKENIQTFEETKSTIDELKNTILELEEALEAIDEDDEEYEELVKVHKELVEEVEALQEELKIQEEELEKTKEFIEDETIEEEYEEAKVNYEEYENEYEHIKETQKNVMELSDDEKVELKKLFKKAARLCHPDIVPDELKAKATELMQQLNDAYSKQDLAQVKQILHSLENGSVFEILSESINDKELIKEKIKEYKQNIANLEKEINNITKDETYQIIVNLDNWDEYFESLKTELEAEKEKLEEESREILEEKVKNNIEDSISEENSRNLFTMLEIEQLTTYREALQNNNVLNFEKIRRYCNNLLDTKNADSMQKYLAENGRMYKALIYDALEQFLQKLENKTITIIDWGCGQGIGSSLVLDYLTEKQLKIQVDKVVLVDDDITAMNRARVHIDLLKENDLEIILIDTNNSNNLKKLNESKNNLTLNLFVNDKMPIDMVDIDVDILGEAYFMCVSNKNENLNFIYETYENMSLFVDIQKISNRDYKIGKFQRYENIFGINI